MTVGERKPGFVLETMLARRGPKWMALGSFQILGQVVLVGGRSLTPRLLWVSAWKGARILKLVRCPLGIKVARSVEAFVVASTTDMIEVSLCVRILRLHRAWQSPKLTGM